MGNIPVSGGGSAAAVWGTITGTLSNQLDLASALNSKASLTSGAAISPVNAFTNTDVGWSDFTICGRIQGASLSQFLATWKASLYFTSGSSVKFSAVVVKRTLSFSTTVIDTTVMKIGGAASGTATISTPLIVMSDAVNLQLDATHDYWLMIHFDSGTPNDALGVGSQGTMAFIAAFVSGDHTGDSTIPALTFTSAPKLWLGISVP